MLTWDTQEVTALDPAGTVFSQVGWGMGMEYKTPFSSPFEANLRHVPHHLLEVPRLHTRGPLQQPAH